jgi:hypothetical protein
MDATVPSMPAALERVPAGIEALAARVAVGLLSAIVRSHVRPGLAPGLVGQALMFVIGSGLTR